MRGQDYIWLDQYGRTLLSVALLLFCTSFDSPAFAREGQLPQDLREKGRRGRDRSVRSRRQLAAAVVAGRLHLGLAACGVRAVARSHLHRRSAARSRRRIRRRAASTAPGDRRGSARRNRPPRRATA
jgi:hypothetical protein